MRTLMDPDIVVVQLPDQPDVSTYRGHEGALRATRSGWGTLWCSWAGFTIAVRPAGLKPSRSRATY